MELHRQIENMLSKQNRVYLVVSSKLNCKQILETKNLDLHLDYKLVPPGENIYFTNSFRPATYLIPDPYQEGITRTPTTNNKLIIITKRIVHPYLSVKVSSSPLKEVCNPYTIKKYEHRVIFNRYLRILQELTRKHGYSLMQYYYAGLKICS